MRTSSRCSLRAPASCSCPTTAACGAWAGCCAPRCERGVRSGAAWTRSTWSGRSARIRSSWCLRRWARCGASASCSGYGRTRPATSEPACRVRAGSRSWPESTRWTCSTGWSPDGLRRPSSARRTRAATSVAACLRSRPRSFPRRPWLRSRRSATGPGGSSCSRWAASTRRRTRCCWSRRWRSSERRRPGVFRLRWVGLGPLLEDVRARAAELGLADRIELLGYLPFPELLPHYRDAHAFVHVSFTEGVPQVLNEALACGLPVVGTDVGGVSEALDGGRAGLLVPPSDRDALVEAVLRVADDDAAPSPAGRARPRTGARPHARSAGRAGCGLPSRGLEAARDRTTLRACAESAVSPT